MSRLNAEIRRIMAEPEMKAQFLAIGTDASTSTPEEFRQFVADEVEKIKRVAKTAGVRGNRALENALQSRLP